MIKVSSISHELSGCHFHHFLPLPGSIWGSHAKLTPSPGFRFMVIRREHALTWPLLAINFASRGIDPDLNGIANRIAAAAGFVYALFIIMTFVVK